MKKAITYKKDLTVIRRNGRYMDRTAERMMAMIVDGCAEGAGNLRM